MYVVHAVALKLSFVCNVVNLPQVCFKCYCITCHWSMLSLSSCHCHSCVNVVILLMCCHYHCFHSVIILSLLPVFVYFDMVVNSVIVTSLSQHRCHRHRCHIVTVTAWLSVGCRPAAVHTLLPGGATATPQLLHPGQSVTPPEWTVHCRPLPRPRVHLQQQCQVSRAGGVTAVSSE